MGLLTVPLRFSDTSTVALALVFFVPTTTIIQIYCLSVAVAVLVNITACCEIRTSVLSHRSQSLYY